MAHFLAPFSLVIVCLPRSNFPRCKLQINDFLIKIDSFPWDVIKSTTPPNLTNELGLIHTTFVMDSIKWQMGKYD